MTTTADRSLQESSKLHTRAGRAIAGGVVSLNRKTNPAIAFARGCGSKLWDVDGNEYIDYHAGFAPHLLGHNDPAISDAVVRAVRDEHSLFGSGTTSWEVTLAEAVAAAVPSCERVQITNTGSEATAHAIRLSRSWTGRDDVVLMLGGYNGWHNEVARAVMPTEAQVGPRVSPGEYRVIPLSAGIPDATLRRLHVINFNDLDSLAYVLRRYDVACVLTEPALQNVGIILPEPGYLQGMRKLCDEHGTVLVFDEVKTGFRSALGGYQSICNVRPDLSVFGKAIANGYPMGVIGGRRDIMDLFCSDDPAKRVLIAGTYNAHPVNCAAALATLERLGADDGAVYRHLEKLAQRLQAGLERIFAQRGIPMTHVRNGSAHCSYFADRAPRDWHAVLQSHDFDLDRRYRVELIKRGIYQFPMPCKQGSISAAHSEADIDRTLEVTEEVLRVL